MQKVNDDDIGFCEDEPEPVLDDQLLFGFNLLKTHDVITRKEDIDAMLNEEIKNYQGKVVYIAKPKKDRTVNKMAIRNTLVFRNGQIELKYNEPLRYSINEMS